MPVFWREGLKCRCAVLVYSDPYTYDEIQAAMLAIWAHPVSEPPFRLLVDRRHSQPPSADLVRRIVSSFAEHRDRLKGGRVALVVNDQTQAAYGMGRMAEILAESKQLPVDVKTFRDWQEAERWLEKADEAAV